MEKPNLMESVTPCSGQYSLKQDLRLNAWLGVAAVVYGVALFLLKHNPEWSPLTRALVSLAALGPGMLYLRACLRFIRGLDELQRRIQTEAWLFALMGTVIVGIVLTTLNAHGVALGGMQPGLNLWGAGMLVFVLWLVGLGLANRRYQ
ncbi:MAG: hypothetical protein Q8M02_07930 [Candidatus Didemnitutus sp.]|nr:hypothetical protein [Candidatus Didemnitutus sp.]